MKRLFALALLCFLSAPAFAQISVELAFDQEQYLPGEECLAKVTIYNSSGQTLRLGEDNEWLSFVVEPRNGPVVRILKNPDVAGEFTLPSAHKATKRVNLAEAYELVNFGRFGVTAVVKIPDWGQTFTSKQRSLDISTGVKLWETRFGVPDEARGRPEIRKYSLLQANNLKQVNLYVRISDESDSFTYKIFTVGPMISFSKPEPQLDQWGNLHVLYQEGARNFRYVTVTPDGMLLSRQTWSYDGDSRPRLGMGEGSRVAVKGGLRRISGNDLPPPDLLSESSSFTPSAQPENELNGQNVRK